MYELNYFDIIVAALIFFLGLKGLIDGFIKEFFGLAGIIGGIYYGSRYAEEIGKWISDNIFYIKNEAALTFLGFLVGLFGIWIAMALLASLITKITHASGMGFFNRFLGVLFGWSKIFLIFAVIIYALSSIEVTKKVLSKYTKHSLLYPYLVKVGGYIIKLKPEDFISPKVKEKIAIDNEKIGQEVEKSALESAKKKIVQSIENNGSKE